MEIRIKTSYFLIAVFIVAGMNLSAQQDTVLRQEVEVTKAYRPSISDVFKINDIPKIEEEKHQKPTFDYSIFSQPVFSTFSVNTLEAAKITGKPKEEQGYGLLKLGAGNYLTPYADIYINNAGSNDALFGLHFRHLSSRGKVKLTGGDKVDAPFSDNTAEVFMKKFSRKTTLSLNASVNRDGFNYYGYPVLEVPAQLLEEGQEINFFGKKQAFSKAAFRLGLENSARSSSAPKLGFDVNYHYFTTKTGQTEHFAGLKINFSKQVNKITAMLDAGAEFSLADSIYNNSISEFGKRQELWIKANPAVQFGNKTISFKAGGKVYAVLDKDRDPAIRVAPDILLKFVPVEGILTFFAGIDGRYEHNYYSKIACENPFIDPMQDVKNTMHQYRFFGGIDGKFSSKTNYVVSAEYGSVKDQPLYYLEAFVYPDETADIDPIIANNDFQVLYDDLKRTKVSLEVYHTASEKFNFLLTGNYYSYETETQTKAWNLPQFDAKLSVGCKVTDRLKFIADIYVIGERIALIKEYEGYDILYPWSSSLIPDILLKSYTLDMIVDLNLKVTYSITNDFSVFAQLNNFGFQSYERWLGYPVQSLKLLGGISYSF